MLCFVFAGLIVALDQFFKRWIMRTLELGEAGPDVIPGVLGLIRWENDGAMLNILSGQQWLLAGIAFVAAVVLIMILLRYNEGFWGTLGLAAVLGGTVGNLADRIFNDGKVVDMFKTLFIDFPIFNIADIFITLGFITFLIHFIALTIKGDVNELATEKKRVSYDESEYDGEYDEGEYADEYAENEYVDGIDIGGDYAQPQSDAIGYGDYSDVDASVAAQVSQDIEDYSVPMSSDYGLETDTASDSSFSLDDMDAELESIDDYNVDDLLREYGFDDDDGI